MADKRQYPSVADVLRDNAPDDTFRADFEERVASRRLVKHLLALRAAKGLSQKDVAEKLGCTQSRISKLENACDSDVRLGDLRAYATAVDCELVISPIPQDLKPVDRVKCHALAVKKHMDDLANLARSDEKVAEGVAGFFFELFVNFVRLLGNSAKLLPLRADDSPYFDLQINRIGCDKADAGDPSCCLESDEVLQSAQ